MKTPKFLAAALLAIASLAMTSCEDWLTIYPQNKLTDEQFWEDMNDLDGVRYAAYRNFASTGVLEKILIWGEFRSDNVLFSNLSNANNYSGLLKVTYGRMDTASAFNDWAAFYTTINYCNQVLVNGEKVLEKDPQFSATQWRRVKAEMIALRALNYFYLVRAFGNVPYINKVVKTDADIEVHKQNLQSDILDSLIRDVDVIKDDVRKYFVSMDETRSLITTPFTYTLLADMCMWRAAKYEGSKNPEDNAKADSVYWRAYEYAAEAVNQMDKQYEGFYLMDQRTIDHYGPYKLLQNWYQGIISLPLMEAYRSLFKEGASDEVIFEMPFTEKDNSKNDIFGKYFGVVTSASKVTFYSNFEGLRQCSPKSSDGKYSDLRLVYSAAYANSDVYSSKTAADAVATHTNGYMMKYCNIELDDYDYHSGTPQYLLKNKGATSYNTFIIYRKSDPLFIQAEALAIMKSRGGAFCSVDDNTARKFIGNVVSEHRRRSYCQYKSYTEDFTGNEFNSADEKWLTTTAYDTLTRRVLDEKQLEFVGEGKRWFDIVRYMERKGANAQAINSMFSDDCKPLSMMKNADRALCYRSTLRARWAFYNPVYYPEREASGWILYQNPYWDDDTTNNDPESGEPDGALEPEQPAEPEVTDETTDTEQPAETDSDEEPSQEEPEDVTTE